MEINQSLDLSDHEELCEGIQATSDRLYGLFAIGGEECGSLVANLLYPQGCCHFLFRGVR